MARHVFSKLTIVGGSDSIKAFKDLFRGRQGRFNLNFELLVPVPIELREAFERSLILHISQYIENGNKESEEYITDHLNYGQSIDDIVTSYKALIEKYGFANKYDWAEHTWGTPLNPLWSLISCESETSLTIAFETAEGGAVPFIKYLSGVFNGDLFYLEYSNEYNVIKDKVIIRDINVCTCFNGDIVGNRKTTEQLVMDKRTYSFE